MREINLAIFAVSHVYNCPTDQIKARHSGGTGAVQAALPCRIAAWVAREKTDASLRDIAKAMEYRDHGAVRKGIQWVIDKRARSDDFRRRSDMALNAYGEWKRGVPFREAGGKKAANSRRIANLCPANLIDANGFESPKHPEFRAGLYGGASYGR